MFNYHASTAGPYGSWRLPRRARLLGWAVMLDARYRQRLALDRLDDRLLRDIGVTRAEVHAEHPRPILPLDGPF